MILFAYGVSSMGNVGSAGWLHGLKLAAVSVVALAVWQMAGKLCPDWPRRSLGLLAAAAVLLIPGALSQVCVIAACAAIGWISWRAAGPSQGAPSSPPASAHAWAGASLLLFALPPRPAARGRGAQRQPARRGLRQLLPAPARSCSGAAMSSFLSSGPRSCRGDGSATAPFSRATAPAQALPGPLFTFAGYLGTLIQPGPRAWMGGLLALSAIFLPAWLLVGRGLPVLAGAAHAGLGPGVVRGTNAAVVGILLTALYRPLCTESIRDVRDVAAAAAAALVLIGPLRIPPWAVVGAMAAAGQWVLR